MDAVEEIFTRTWFSNVVRGSQGTTARLRRTGANHYDIACCENRDGRIFRYGFGGEMRPNSFALFWNRRWHPPHHEIEISGEEQHRIYRKIRNVAGAFRWQVSDIVVTQPLPAFGPLSDGQDVPCDGVVLTPNIFWGEFIEARLDQSGKSRRCSIPVCLDPINTSPFGPRRILFFSRVPLRWQSPDQEIPMSESDRMKMLGVVRTYLAERFRPRGSDAATKWGRGWKVVEVGYDYMNQHC